MQSSDKGQITIGEDVLANDGEKVGSVTYVVVQPPRMHVTGFVVGTGVMLGRDVVVPAENVARVDAYIQLSLSKDELASLPDYVEVQYEQPPEGWMPPTGFAYPTETTLWPLGAYTPAPASVTVNLPLGTVALHEGMDVESSDGHKIGTVGDLEIDPDSANLTAFIVKHGFLHGSENRFTVESISKISEDKVQLRLSHGEAESRFKGDSGADVVPLV